MGGGDASRQRSSRRAGSRRERGRGTPIDTALNWENSRERIQERAQRYAHRMSYPGNQITARPQERPDEEREYWPGEHPSGPIGPFGPIREGTDGPLDEISAAIYGDYALPTRNSQQGSRPDGPAPGNGRASRPPAVPRQRRGRHAGGGGYDADQAPGQVPGPSNRATRPLPGTQGAPGSGLAVPPPRAARARRGPANG